MLNPQQLAGAYWARKRNRVSTAVIDDLQAPAVGAISWPANIGDTETIHINGTLVTFVAGTPGAAQVKIGATLADTLAAFAAFLVDNPISGVTVFVSGSGLTILSAKPGDNTIAISASAGSVSGAHLTRQQINARVPL